VNDQNEIDLIKLKNAFYELIPVEKQAMFDQIASLRTNHLTVLLENIYQEHNASAVVRTCDCFGIRDLHVVESKNKYKVQRDIARGAGKWVKMINYSDGKNPLNTALTNLKSNGYKIAALTPDANAFTLLDLPLDQPIALCFGTEGDGISEQVRNEADYLVEIPMYGFTESFNVSVSVSLTLQMLRYRLDNQNSPWLLNTIQQLELKTLWCERYMKRGDKIKEELCQRLGIQS
jgi:tRNA (guanosine-2'-O-)-methyltransferase